MSGYGAGGIGEYEVVYIGVFESGGAVLVNTVEQEGYAEEEGECEDGHRGGEEAGGRSHGYRRSGIALETNANAVLSFRTVIDCVAAGVTEMVQGSEM
jgi:hypothetical protein